MAETPISGDSVKVRKDDTRKGRSWLNSKGCDFKARQMDWSVNFIPVGILVHEVNNVAHRSDTQYRAVVKVAPCSSDQKEFPLDFYVTEEFR